MKKDYTVMSKYELLIELKRLRDNLKDLEETMNFHYTFSSAHISGEQAKKDEQTLDVLKQEIATIELIISQGTHNTV
jgi:hypothetical protein